MTKGNYPYPEDEFDAAPGPDSPVGVHRAPRSWWSRWWPFVAVIVLVPAVTVGAVLWTSAWDGLGGDDDQASVELTDDPVVGAETGGTEETAGTEGAEGTEGTDEPPAEEPPAEEEPPAPAIDYAQTVDVLNAARRNGLAADVKDQLETAGFTSVTAGNGSASTAEVTTVFYASPELQPTAQAVADALGITTVTESAADAGSGVVVLLRTDFLG
ncbi:LytR C-terminal domain-containing protein [Cellulomonas sp. NPDC089187]|uniref:LytR C-terminal domain-containing protein n=1 Tax=Cellulomonas sp. NPDC089187 TaxID=3154970 RepID=UPI0034130D20